MAKYKLATDSNIDEIVEDIRDALTDLSVYDKDCKKKAIERIQKIYEQITYGDLSFGNGAYGNRAMFAIIAYLDGDPKEKDWTIIKTEIIND